MKWAILVVLDYNISGARVLDFFCIVYIFKIEFLRSGTVWGPVAWAL